MSYYMQNKKTFYRKAFYRKAFAFSITMWIIASLLFATVVILRFAKDELGLSKGLNNKLQTQLMAGSVLESLKFYVPTADYTSTSLKNSLLVNTEYPLPSEIIVDGREYNITKELSISLRDTSSMFNIKSIPSKLVAYSLTSKNSEDLVSILKDSLDDWRDVDNVAGVNGAEQSSYKKVLVRDTKAIQDIHELKIIKGFDKIDIERIKDNFYYGRGSPLNLMLIKNRRYLAHLLGTDESFMENMLELRQTEPLKFRKNLNNLPGFDDEYMGLWLSKQFLINIKAKKERAETRIKAIISFKQLGNRPYITVSYIIN